MNRESLPIREMVARRLGSLSRFLKIWIGLSLSLFIILAISFRLLYNNVQPQTLVYASALLSIGISYSLGYLYYVLRYAYRRVAEIVDEEETLDAAIGRIGVLGATGCMSLIFGGLLIFGETPFHFTFAVVLLLGTLLISGRIIEYRMPLRELSPQERSACGDALDPDVQYRTVVGSFGETVNGVSSGVLPSHKAVLLHEGAFKRLEDEHIEAIAAHELGHVVEDHATYLMVSGAVTMFMSLLTIRFLLRQEWRALLIVGALALVSSILAAALKRRLEFRADRYAARHLGDPEQVANELRELQDHPVEADEQSGSTLSDRLIPDAIQDLSARITSTHPSKERRIEHLQQLSVGTDSQSGDD